MMIKVSGFLFEDEKTAQIARREEEGIRYIKQRTALDNSEVVLKLYKKLLEQEIFVTPVGYRFLAELQDILLDSPSIAGEEILPIPVKASEETPKDEPVIPAKKVETKDVGNYRTQFHVATLFAIIFGISVIGMFAITAISRNNINIINYKDQLLNEYSSWEKELKSKEERLELWEERLEELEAQLREQINNGE